MKQYLLRRLAGGLSAALLCLAPAGALAQQQAAEGVHKQETVYGELYADGSLKGTTVSVYLSNPEGLEKIEDVTNLESLETLAGELPPGVDADGSPGMPGARMCSIRVSAARRCR